ncbi:anti-sigma 24 factor [Candidatus Hamiltonella defensa]|uniref:Anti-sigma 24 factor n=1 Tax=Candidatus Williamhamiltonella defendens TaxID=138072 RepID=A0AAC9VKW7_9ENTR|nr:RseA family anti-sigma factor [Candidatus Hamiltonella defensa]ASV33730.1 anti-sigma 24 factor [Candidatus Hamiltonella defensa]AWK16683.1 anti-sigma 24 factor [Candidatus Hamiltonella defensa]MBK4360753.1 anti-sigma 24 factor [Candidatus Hamiltonella defensa]
MQKEKLSALIDDEILDDELLHLLSKDKVLQKSWQNYHLIGDALRHDLANPLCLDMSDRILEVIKNDPVCINTSAPAIETSRDTDDIPFWQKIRPWVSQLTQIAVAASVSLVVVLSGHYQSSDQSELPTFNISPMIELKPAPVSFGLHSNVGTHAGKSHHMKKPSEEEQNASEEFNLLHKFELKRRTSLPLEPHPPLPESYN